ncbi:hypothetical protein TRVL_10200 [Trypanosoma vivax]|nr:hypothetical protein TRVL_10200 [Trypanosoma vivax]
MWQIVGAVQLTEGKLCITAVSTCHAHAFVILRINPYTRWANSFPSFRVCHLYWKASRYRRMLCCHSGFCGLDLFLCPVSETDNTSERLNSTAGVLQSTC